MSPNKAYIQTAVRVEVKVRSEGTATNDTQLLRRALKVGYMMRQWLDI